MLKSEDIEQAMMKIYVIRLFHQIVIFLHKLFNFCPSTGLPFLHTLIQSYEYGFALGQQYQFIALNSFDKLFYMYVRSDEDSVHRAS